MKKIAIIGAGISGLYLANIFKQNSDFKVLLFEKNEEIYHALPQKRDIVKFSLKKETLLA